MKKQTANLIRNILYALAVAVFGFILLNLTFLFYAAVAWLIIAFIPGGQEAARQWIGPVSSSVATVFIGLFSWLVFKSKLATIYKAIFMTVPTAVVLVLLAIIFFSLPAVVAYSIDGAIVAGTLFFFYWTKQPWLYWFAVIAVAIALAIMFYFGVEI